MAHSRRACCARMGGGSMRAGRSAACSRGAEERTARSAPHQQTRKVSLGWTSYLDESCDDFDD